MMIIPAPTDRALRAPEVFGMLGVSRTTFYALIRRGQFPAGIMVTETQIRWMRSVVEQWLAERPASDGTAGHADVARAAKAARRSKLRPKRRPGGGAKATRRAGR